MRAALNLLVAAATFGFGLAAAEPIEADTTLPSPNVLVIVTDDQRAANTMRVLPHVRRWFRDRGTEFTRAFATTPTCCPSRASILTGRYAHNHGVTTTEAGQPEKLDQSTTLQRHLQEAGYRTGLYGKFLNHWDVERDPPFFDSWAMFSDGAKTMYHGGRWNVDGRVRTVNRYSTDFVARKSIRFLEEAESDDDAPWFLYVTPLAPHPPSTPAREYESARIPEMKRNPAMLEEDLSDKPDYVQRRKTPSRKIEMLRKLQLRSLMSVDDLVRGLLRRMGDLDERNDTLAFFLSDNGYMWGEHGRGGKRYPYIPSVKIPFLVRWPGEFAPGMSDDRLAATIDIFPTVVEATGIVPEHEVDGRSLLGSDTRDRLLLEHWQRGRRATPDWAGLMSDTYQYTEYYVEGHLVPEFHEYYDLVIDPWELVNLLGDDDEKNDPDFSRLALQLARDLRCRGQEGTASCP